MSANAQTDRQLWRQSHLEQQWYSTPLSARSGSDLVEGYCNPSNIGRQTGVNPCGFPFAFLLTDRSRFVHLFRREIASLDSWIPYHQTRGLELGAEHETGENPT